MNLTVRRSLLAIFSLFLIFITNCCHKKTALSFNDSDLEYSKILQQEISKNGDIDSKLALARLYFDYEDNENADRILVKLVEDNPANMEALSWYGANNCKIADKKPYWLMGIDKLFLVKKCLQQIDKALENNPTEYSILLVNLNTAYAVDMFGSLKKAKNNVKVFDDYLKLNQKRYSNLYLADFYYIAGLIEEKSNNKDEAKNYFVKIVNDNAKADLVEKAKQKLIQYK